tara:strand:- start:121 stop:741 length:621 start_codon:yes stop_codon:yes gene_type:complete
MIKELFKQIEINELKVKKKKIEFCSFKYENLNFDLVKLSDKELHSLYTFFIKFSNEERVFFPFPLFKPVDITFDELRKNYKDYLSENSWVYFLLLFKNDLIGFTLLKKIGFKNTINTESKSPTSGIFIDKKFRGKNIGSILQKFITLQCNLLGIENIYVRVSDKNIGSQKVYRNNGFKKTGKTFNVEQNGFKWTDEEYILNLNDNN